MTQRVPLPTADDITRAIDALMNEAGRPPAALAVATRLGMSNATFWRHFPLIARELADSRREANRTVRRQVADASATNHRSTIARLRVENARLLNEVNLAAAEVQRLTLENHGLRTQREQLARVTAIRPHS